jgi:hypothetical protein
MGGVRAMVLKELAKAAVSQPAGPGEAPEGVAHVDTEYTPGSATYGVAEGNPGGAPASLERPHGDAP